MNRAVRGMRTLNGGRENAGAVDWFIGPPPIRLAWRKILTCEITPQERLNLTDFAISLPQPLDSGACRLFIAVATIAVYDLGQLLTEFIRQLVAAGEILEGPVARPKWNQASPDALLRHAKQDRRQCIRVELLKVGANQIAAVMYRRIPPRAVGV